MKKHLILLPIVTGIVFFASCKKDPVGDPATAERVKSYSEELISDYYGNYVKNYEVSYDANGRVVSIMLTPVADTRITFQYPSVSEYISDTYSKNGVTIHENYYMNSNSFVDSTFQYNNTQDSSTEKVIYNSDHQVIEVYNYRYSQITGSVLKYIITNTYNADGDLIRSAGTNNNVTTYEYYTDLSYATPIILGTRNVTSAKKNHLLKKNTLTSNGYLAGSSDITYTFDNKNRISTEKQIFTNGATFIKTYIYL